MKPFESQGLWYLPDKQDQTVAGTLSFTTDRGLVLKLAGTFREQVFSGTLSSYPMIHGTISESPYGKAVSLLACNSTSMQIGMPGIALETIHANHGFVGSFYVNSHDELFEEASFNFVNLGAWIAVSTLSMEHPAQSLTEMKMIYRQRDEIKCSLDGAELSIGFAVSTKASRVPYRKLSMIEEPFITVKSFGKITTKQIDDRFYAPLSQLITFAADDNSPLNRYRVETKIDGRDYSADRLFATSFPRRDPKNRDTFEMLFGFPNVQGRFEEFLRSWFSFVNKYKDFVSIFFSYGYGHQTYLEDRFAFLMIAVSCYLREQYSDLAELKQYDEARNRLLSQAPFDAQPHSILTVPSVVELAMPSLLGKLLSDYWELARKIIPVSKERFQDELFATWAFVKQRGTCGPDAKRGGELHWLTERMSWIMKFCILRHLGFSDEHLESLQRNNPTCLHLSQLKESGEAD